MTMAHGGPTSLTAMVCDVIETNDVKGSAHHSVARILKDRVALSGLYLPPVVAIP